MRRRGFLQSDAARYLGLPEPTVSKILSGGDSLGLRRAIHVERLTGIPVEAWAASELEESVEAGPQAAGKRRVSK